MTDETVTISKHEYDDLKADAERYRRSIQAPTSAKDVKELNYKVQVPKEQDFGF